MADMTNDNPDIEVVLHQVIEKADTNLPRIIPGSLESFLTIGNHAYEYFRYVSGSDSSTTGPNRRQIYTQEFYRVRKVFEDIVRSDKNQNMNELILKEFDNDPNRFADTILRYANNVIIYCLMKLERAYYEKIELDEFISNDNIWLDPDYDNPEYFDYIDNVESKYKYWYQQLSDEELRKVAAFFKLLRSNSNG
jgi:hypothetical protein